LSNALGDFTGLGRQPPELKDFELDELEVIFILMKEPKKKTQENNLSQIQKGLTSLAQGLEFCHNFGKIVHGNLIPQSVYINSKVFFLSFLSFPFLFILYLYDHNLGRLENWRFSILIPTWNKRIYTL